MTDQARQARPAWPRVGFLLALYGINAVTFWYLGRTYELRRLTKDRGQLLEQHDELGRALAMAMRARLIWEGQAEQRAMPCTIGAVSVDVCVPVKDGTSAGQWDTLSQVESERFVAAAIRGSGEDGPQPATPECIMLRDFDSDDSSLR